MVRLEEATAPTVLMTRHEKPCHWLVTFVRQPPLDRRPAHPMLQTRMHALALPVMVGWRHATSMAVATLLVHFNAARSGVHIPRFRWCSQ